MIKYLSAAAILAGLAFAAPASAQSFQGPYVGAQAGWNQDDVGSVGSELGRLDLDEKSDRIFGGVFAGYDQMVTPNIVVGIEAGFDIAADDAERVGSTLIDPNYSFDVGGRVGYVVKDNTLLYVRGSYENMRARIQNQVGTGVATAHDNFDGWGIGAGVEHELGDRLSARAEYRYSDLGNGGSFDRHQVLLGIAYHL